MLPAETTILAEFQLVGGVFLVFGGGVVTLLAFGAGEGDDVSHCFSFTPRCTVQTATMRMDSASSRSGPMHLFDY
jgi:hypothetical protein